MKTGQLLAITFLAAALQTGPANTATAQQDNPPHNPAVVGNDISWPQCNSELPEPPAFAVLGVNGGRPDVTNPCLATQLAWAGGTAAATAGTPVPVYVNTANPGPGGSWWWPTSNAYAGKDVTNPYGTCDGTATPACAYMYGYAMAFDAANLRGVPDPAHRLWWLDVETENSWLPDTAANAADLEGMTAYLQGIGAEVGLYSTGYQFGQIAGSVSSGSALYRLKAWIPGADSTASALAACAGPPLTPGGSVALAQFVAGSLDYNVVCPTLTAPLEPAGAFSEQTPGAPPAPLPGRTPSPGRTPRNIT